MFFTWPIYQRRLRKGSVVWAQDEEWEVVVPPPEATARIRVLERAARMDVRLSPLKIHGFPLIFA